MELLKHLLSIWSFSILFLCLISLLTASCNWTFQEIELELEPPTPWTCGCDLVDERDGHVYPTVQIGSQCWIAKNLDYGKMLEPYQESVEIYKYCLFDLPDSCQSLGGFYNWEMVQKAESLGGICPKGWKLPTDIDWKVLEQTLLVPPNEIDSVDKNFDCYNRGNSYNILTQLDGLGFAPLTSRYLLVDDNFCPMGERPECAFKPIPGVGKIGAYWSGTVMEIDGIPKALYRQMRKDCEAINRISIDISKTSGFCVRCILDDLDLTDEECQ